MHAMTKVKLKPITRDNYMDAFRLKVHPAQEDLVADNIGSLAQAYVCLLYTSPSPRDLSTSRMPSSA